MDAANPGGPHTTMIPLNNKTREWLLQESDIVSNYLRIIRSQLNAQAIACRLPEELLLNIFGYISSASFSNLRWIGVTHVCRYWRHTALASQALWSFIAPRNPSYVFACVHRAGNSPLHLRWDSTSEDPDFRPVKPYTHRFVTVDLQLSGPGVVALNASGCFNSLSSWDKLEYLAISSRSKTTTLPVISLSSIIDEPPTKLFLLRLKRVVPVSWSPLSACRSLRHLHLVHGRGSDLVRPSMDVFLDILQAFPLLEDLNLDNAGPKLPGTDPLSHPEPKRKVELNHLRELFFAFDRGVDLAHLLAHLVIPSTAHIHIERLHRVYNSVDPGIASCLPPDRSNIRMIDSNTLSSIRVGSHNIESESYLDVGAYHDEHVLNMYPCLHIVSHKPDDDFYANETVRTLLLQFGSLFVFAPVRKLHLVFRLAELSCIKAADWLQILLPFLSLVTLVLDVEDLASDETAWNVEYMRALLSVLTHVGSDYTSPIVVPHLERLLITRLRQSTLEGLKDALDKCRLSRKHIPHFRVVLNDTYL